MTAPVPQHEPAVRLAEHAAAAVAERTGRNRHDLAVVLGSGWRAAADLLGPVHAEIPIADLPGFTAPTAAGHGGTVRSVQVADRSVLVLLGRAHAYEGHDLTTVVHPVRTAIAAGADTVVLTNACGGIRADLQVGDAVLIADHLNLTGRSPLIGPQFTDLTDAYDPKLRAAARRLDPTLTEGIYAGLPGPHYETPAEIRMLAALGADLVGMSTVHETIAARAAGARVLGISLVTNAAAGTTDARLDHAAVLAAGDAAAVRMGRLLATLVAEL